MRLSWERYALVIARAASMRSEDPYVKTGAAAVRHDMSIAGVGYNGAPSGVEIDWTNRSQRGDRVIHAERNCLRYCNPGEIAFIAATMSPCRACLIDIASYKIGKVVYEYPYDKSPETFALAREFGIELKQIDISSELDANANQLQKERDVFLAALMKHTDFLTAPGETCAFGDQNCHCTDNIKLTSDIPCVSKPFLLKVHNWFARKFSKRIGRST